MKTLDIVMERGPGPKSQFVECEVDGSSVRVGTWGTDAEGYAVLRLKLEDVQRALQPAAHMLVSPSGGQDS